VEIALLQTQKYHV